MNQYMFTVHPLNADATGFESPPTTEGFRWHMLSAGQLGDGLRAIVTWELRPIEDPQPTPEAHIDVSAPMKKEPGPAPWGGLTDLLAKVTIKVSMRRRMGGMPLQPQMEVAGTSQLVVRAALYVLAAQVEAATSLFQEQWRVDVDTAGSLLGWVYIDLNSVDDAEAERALSLLKRIAADVAARTASR